MIRHNIVTNDSIPLQCFLKTAVSFLLGTDHFSQTKPNPLLYFNKRHITVFFYSFFTLGDIYLFLTPRCAHLKITLIFHYTQDHLLFHSVLCCSLLMTSESKGAVDCREVRWEWNEVKRTGGQKEWAEESFVQRKICGKGKEIMEVHEVGSSGGLLIY